MPAETYEIYCFDQLRKWNIEGSLFIVIPEGRQGFRDSLQHL